MKDDKPKMPEQEVNYPPSMPPSFMPSFKGMLLFSVAQGVCANPNLVSGGMRINRGVARYILDMVDAIEAEINERAAAERKEAERAAQQQEPGV